MKAPHLSAALLLLPAVLACAEVIPAAFPASRYEKMLTDSPFALATATAPLTDTTKGWAANLYLGPVWRISRDGEEREYVVVKSIGDVTGSYTLTGHDPGPEGVELVKLEWNEDIKKTKAVLKKGAETATIEADQSGAPAPVPQPQLRATGVPGQPGQNNPNALRRPAVPGVPQPVIPRPTAVPPAINPAPAANQPNRANQPNPNSGNDRQRVRVINSK